jgi:type I restriction enzyme S subunit
MKLLSKYVEFKNGKKRPTSKGTIPVYGGNGILDYTNTANMQSGVVIGRVGVYCGSVFLVREECWVSDNAIKAMCKENMDLGYLYYLLSSLHLNERRIGTSQPLLTQSILNNIEVEIPELAIQKRISSILELFDEKIKLNNKINNNLEQQAQALFKEWFIDNPENIYWSTGTFRELIQSTLNGDWGKETPTGNNIEKVYCIRGADIPEVKAGNKGKMPTRYILPKNLANKKLEAGDIVVEISGGSPTQSTGRCTAITQSLLDRYDSSMVCTNFCKAIKPKNGYSLFVYYYWQYLYEKSVFFSYENGTTGIKNLDFTGFIETEPIIVPPFDKVQAFDDYCKSIFNQVFANGKQSEQLSSLRDTLLPRLMFGELDVANIDI